MSAIVKYFGLIIGLVAIRVSGRGTWNATESYEYYVSKPGVNQDSFADAQKFCEDQDGWLALVKTQTIQDFIESLVPDQNDPGIPYAFYIGLRNKDGKYAWEDGEDLNFQYFVNTPPTPDNSKQCVAMNGNGMFTYNAEMKWSNIKCEDHKLSIGQVCQRLIGRNWGSWQSWNECTCLELRQRNRTCEDSGRMGPNSCAGGSSVENGTCTPPPECNVTIAVTTTVLPPPGRGEWVANGVYEYYVSKPSEGRSYDDSQTFCNDEEGELAIVKSEVTQEFISSLVSDEDKEGVPYGFYIGLRYNENLKKHMWTDGSSLEYKPWAIGEPNFKENDEFCVAMGDKYTYSRDLLWHDYRCYTGAYGKKGLVCQRRIGKYWSNWGTFSGCNCNTDNETRSRTCKDSGREGPDDCVGATEETRDCPYEPACYTTTAYEITTPNPTTTSTSMVTTTVSTSSPETTSAADPVISTLRSDVVTTTIPTKPTTSPKTTSVADSMISTEPLSADVTTMSTASTPPKTTSVTDSMISTAPLSAYVTTASTASTTPLEATSVSDPPILTSRSVGDFTTMSTGSTTPPKTTFVSDSMILTAPLNADVTTMSTASTTPLEATSVSDPLILTSRSSGSVTMMSTGSTTPLKTTSVTDPRTSTSSSEEILVATDTFVKTSYATDGTSSTTPSPKTSSSDIMSMTMPKANATSNGINSVTDTSLVVELKQTATTTSTAKINSGVTKMQTSPAEATTAEAQNVITSSSKAQTFEPSVKATTFSPIQTEPEVEPVESTASEPSSTASTLGNIAGPAPRNQNIVAPVVASIGGFLLVALIIVLTYMVYKRRKMTGSSRITREVELRRRGSDRQSLTDDANRIVMQDPNFLEDGRGSNASAINPMFSFLDDDLYASNDKNTAETSSLTHQEDESGPSGVTYAVVNKNRSVRSISSVSSASAEGTGPNHVEVNGDTYAVVTKIKPSQPTTLGSPGPYAESSTSI